MKTTKNKSILFAMIIAGAMVAHNAQGQTTHGAGAINTNCSVGTSGTNHTLLGCGAGQSNSGSNNTFTGYNSGNANTTGSSNSLFGVQAGLNNVTGDANSIVGYQAGNGVASNSYAQNSLFGYQAGYAITTGSNNVMAGFKAGFTNTTGSTLTILGHSADVGGTGLTNASAIGANATVMVSNDMILGDNSTDVGIRLDGDATGPLSPLSVGGSGNALYEIFGYQASTSNSAQGIRGEVITPTSSSNKAYATVGVVTTGTGSTFGIYGSSQRGTAAANGRAYGVYGIASNATTGYNYGVYGILAGTNSGAGVFGTDIGDLDVTTTGSTGTFAGYFYGDLLTTDDTPEKLNAGSWSGYSDKRLKKDIVSFTDGLNVLRQINPMSYKYNDIVPGFSTGKTYMGVLAQDIQSVAPYCVGTSQLKIKQSNSQAFAGDIVETIPADSAGESKVVVNALTYNPDGLFYAMINAIKQLDSTVTALQNQLGGQRNGGGNGQGDKSATIHDMELASDNAIIYQNAPNPFGDGTMIKYFIPENAQNVQMVFFDEFGSKLKEFNITEIGMGELNLSTMNLASGIYSYSLIVNGKAVDTKKMIKNQ